MHEWGYPFYVKEVLWHCKVLCNKNFVAWYHCYLVYTIMFTYCPMLLGNSCDYGIPYSLYQTWQKWGYAHVTLAIREFWDFLSKLSRAGLTWAYDPYQICHSSWRIWKTRIAIWWWLPGWDVYGLECPHDRQPHLPPLSSCPITDSTFFTIYMSRVYFINETLKNDWSIYVGITQNSMWVLHTTQCALITLSRLPHYASTYLVRGWGIII